MTRAEGAIVLLIACTLLLGQVENKAIFGIGMRIIGDKLLVKDVLQSRPAGLAENPTVGFNYAIPEPITYIEILSEQNVLAEVNFSYHNDLVKGTVTAIIISNDTMTATDTTIDPSTSSAGDETATAKPFEILITIYGFNETMLNVDPAYVLNRDQQFEGSLEPQLHVEQEEQDDDNDDYEDEQYLNVSDGALEKFEGTDVDFAFGEADGDWDFVAEHADKVIEVGQRQQGDYLLYETHQTSSELTQLPTNHSVVFYYIDSNFITYGKFVIFDHYVGKTGEEYTPPIAEYSHFSANTLKAVVTDYATTSLFVQMLLYGYNRSDVPIDYVPYLSKSQQDANDGTESSMEPLQRLKILMKAHKSVMVVTQTEAPAQGSDEAGSTTSAGTTSTSVSVHLLIMTGPLGVSIVQRTVWSVVSLCLFFAALPLM